MVRGPHHTSCLEAALAYAAQGIPVFPVQGKIPLRGTRGFYEATTDCRMIEAWWQRFPDANVAVPTGSASGWAVLDVDERHGGLKGVYRFLILLHQQLRARNGQMDWWVLAAQCERSFAQEGEIYHVLPDAEWQCTLAGEQSCRCWLDWDTGTMQQQGLTRKLLAYARYARSREWAREHLTSLPLLLFVAPDPAQEDRISRLLQEMRLSVGLRVLTTTRTRLVQAGGPLSAIWRNPLAGEAAMHKRRSLFPDLQPGRGKTEEGAL